MAEERNIPSVDIAVVGGGAAGLAAASMVCRAAERPLSVAILEKAPRVGRKLLATGNGTCNISNRYASPTRYHGRRPDFTAPALSAFTAEDARAFFTSIGVECTERENGRLYPLCEQAGAVLDCLRLECQACGVQELCDTAVTAIRPAGKEFTLETSRGVLRAKRVLVVTGGAASPSLGGGADSYGLLTALGHTRTPLFPSIVQVRTDVQYVKAVKGVRVDATVSFVLNGKPLAEETGEVLFTEYGLSGPAVMQISRAVSDWERRRQGAMTAVLNLLPGMTGAELSDSLRRRIVMSGRTCGDLLTGLLQKRLGQTVLRSAGYGDLAEPVSSLTEGDRQRIADAITRWTIPVTGTQGMNGAQVTAGGIDTDGFDPRTMESRVVPGLYAAGEVLDIDGDCGGFNLQWAWASAYAAAKAMAASLSADHTGKGDRHRL